MDFFSSPVDFCSHLSIKFDSYTLEFFHFSFAYLVLIDFLLYILFKNKITSVYIISTCDELFKQKEHYICSMRCQKHLKIIQTNSTPINMIPICLYLIMVVATPPPAILIPFYTCLLYTCTCSRNRYSCSFYILEFCCIVVFNSPILTSMKG